MRGPEYPDVTPGIFPKTDFAFMELKTVAILFLCISCSGILCLVYYSTRFLKTPGSRPFTWFMSSVFIYSLGYMLELSGSSYAGIYFALKIEYLGIPFVSVFWFLFALEYSNYKIKSKPLYTSLFIIPITTTILLYTNESNHLLYKKFLIDFAGPFPMASIVKGTWYYIDFAYAVVLSLAGVALFFAMTRKTQGYRKKQATTIFRASLIPWGGHVLNMLIAPPAGIDPAPFYLSIAVPIFAFAMFRLRLFDIAPIARARAFETINTPIVVLDRNFLIADFNTAASGIFPELTRDVIGQTAQEVLGAHKELLEKLPPAGDGPLEIDHEVEKGIRHFSVSVTKLLSPKQKYLGLIILLYDITEKKLMLDKLRDMATVDALTQVRSRRFFMESCLQTLRALARRQGSLAFLLIDIDHFKEVNDTYGHIAGDLVLQGVTEGFRSILRDGDIIGRYGGEEFTILLPDTDIEGAAKLSERLRTHIEEISTSHEDTDIRVTVSVGISGVSFAAQAAGIDFEKVLATLLQDADQALYTAKETGRNQVCLAAPAARRL